MFRFNQFRVLMVLGILMSIMLAACGGQIEPAAAVPTAPAALATPEAPTPPVASVSPTPSEGPLPVAAWNLDGDGTDSAGDFNLEFSGAYEFSDTAVAFDGYTGSASTAAPGPIDPTASFSVSAWLNFAERNSEYSVAVGQLGEVTGSFGLVVGSTGEWEFSMKKEDRSGPEYTVSANGGPAVPSNSWTHLVGIYDKDAGLLHLYVNGEPQAEAALTTPIKANGPLTIGHGLSNSLPDSYWSGSVGDVVLYQAALTAEQVAQIYQTTKPASPPPPVPAPDPSTYANGILNGTWDVVMAEEDRDFFEADLEAESGYEADELRYRMGFNNHKWWQGFVFDGELWLHNGIPEGSGGIFYIEGDRLIQIDGEFQSTYAWVLNNDQLTLTVVEECITTPTGRNCTDDRSQMDPIMIKVTEHTYTKSGGDGNYNLRGQ